MAKFEFLRPFLENRMSLESLARRQGISIRTARRWARAFRDEGLPGLSPKTRGDKGKCRLSRTLSEIIEAFALEKPRLSIAAIHRKVAAIATERGERAPRYCTVYTIIKALDPALVALAHEGASAYGDRFELIHRREADSPNAIWQADHTELDVWVRNDRGEPQKPWLTIILDDHSRAVAGYFLSHSAPSALHTALALRQAIWRKSRPGWKVCGIPQILYTDHGSDFTSKHIEQVVADLKIQLVFSSIGKPRGRGKIERFFESLSQVFLSTLPGYAIAKSRRVATLTIPELSALLEDYLIDEYHVRQHSATGESPQQRWEGTGFLPNMPQSIEQLDLLLLTVPKRRRVHPDGIHFLGMRYIDPTLAAFVGEQVLIRYDPRDIAETRVFHEDRFACRAVCQELAGETVALREIVGERKRRRIALGTKLRDRKRLVDSLLEARRWQVPEPEPDLPAKTQQPKSKSPQLKRYLHD